ncbi:hypothetical protein TNCV_873601 [Trichonephila clavipes]|nr:hypothetical protein TNCV_873601 [Trichonephila clavipes]
MLLLSCPSRRRSKKSWQSLRLVVLLYVLLSLALALSTVQVTIRFSSVPPQFRGRTLLGGSPTSLPLPPTSREDLKLDGYLEYPPAAKALYIYKYPYLPRDLNQGPTA